MEELRKEGKNLSYKGVNPNSFEKISDENSDDFNLSELIKIVKRRKKLVIFSTVTVFSLLTVQTIYTRIFKPTYQGTFSLLISDPLSSDEGDFEINNSIIENIAKNNTQNDIPTLITLLKSPSLIEPIANQYNFSYEELNKMIFIDNLIIDRRRADGILKVNIRINNKKKGLEILNDLSKTYLEAALKQKQRKISDGLQFLNNQSPAIQKKNVELQRQLEEFRKKYSLIEPTQEGAMLKEQVMEIDKNILEIESNMNRLKDVRKEILNGKLTARSFEDIVGSSDNSSFGGLVFSDIDQGLLKTLISLETELANASAKYTKGSRIIKGLEKRVQEIQPLFIENQLKAVDIAINLASSQIKTKKEQKDLINESFLNKPTLIKKFNNLKQRLDLSQQNLNSLLSAREKFQLEMAQGSFPWRVIAEPKMREKPIKPSIPKNTIFALFIGFFLSILFAWLRDRFDFVFHTEEEIKEDLKMPILGNIPYIDSFKSVRNQVDEFLNSFENKNLEEFTKEEQYQRFFYQESLRTLFTSLRFIDGDIKNKIICLTSSIPKEGKSLLNLLFAKTLSDLGQKVLILDCDMRKPIVHKRLKINNLKGLSNYLTEPNMNLSNVIQKAKKFGNLDVITAGPIPPDATRLIGSDKMKNLIKELKNNKEYNYILIDMPPVLGISDVSLLSEKIDGIILLVSTNYVNRNLPKESINRIRMAGGNLLGILVNSTQKQKSSANLNSVYNAYSEYVGDKENMEDKDIIYSEDSTQLKISRFGIKINLGFLTNLKKMNNKFFNWLDN